MKPGHVVWTYSGVRPLLEDASGDPSAVTRDYLLDLDDDRAPLLTVWGGKITTFRKLAEEAADLLAPTLPQARGAWTHGAILPGGDLRAFIGEPQRPDTDFARFEHGARSASSVPAGAAASSPGARLRRSRRADPAAGDLGAEVAPGLHVAELDYLHRHEWARSADDVLWRRSKLGLHLDDAGRAAVARWCETNWPIAVKTTTSPAPTQPLPAGR